MFKRIRLFYPIISVHQTSLIGLWRTMLWTKHRFNIVQQRIMLSKQIEGMLPSGKSMLSSAVGLIQLQSSKPLRDSIHSIMTSKTFNLKFKVFQTYRALWSLDLHEYKFTYNVIMLLLQRRNSKADISLADMNWSGMGEWHSIVVYDKGSLSARVGGSINSMV